jgi:hypothetical protein
MSLRAAIRAVAPDLLDAQDYDAWDDDKLLSALTNSQIRAVKDFLGAWNEVLT